MNKKPENFLLDFVKLCADTEIPDIFALWCAISSVSCVLGRNSWIDMGTYTIYPNLYIVLVAGSGRCRKSTSIGMAKRLLRQLEPAPNIIAQKITPEALIEALQLTTCEEDKILKPSCEGYVVADELSTFLNRKTYDSGLNSLLIQLYDCEEYFEYRTRGRGSEKLYNTCLGLLGASTIDWIRTAIPRDAIGGGLTSRIIFVYMEDPPPPVAITSFSKEKQKLLETLIRSLHKFQLLNGAFNLSKQSWNLYQQMYDGFYRDSELYDNPTLAGYASRRHVFMLKLSMILSASEGLTNQIIEERHLRGAEDILKRSEVFMPRVLGLITMSERGAQIDTVGRYLEKKQQLSRQELLRSFIHQMDVRDLDIIIESLVHSGRIQVRSSGKGLFYVATTTY